MLHLHITESHRPQTFFAKKAQEDQHYDFKVVDDGNNALKILPPTPETDISRIGHFLTLIVGGDTDGEQAATREMEDFLIGKTLHLEAKDEQHRHLFFYERGSCRGIHTIAPLPNTKALPNRPITEASAPVSGVWLMQNSVQGAVQSSLLNVYAEQLFS
jgi:hypothetical protein